MPSSVDHVIVAVPNLDAAAHEYADRLGFAVSAGGVHPGAGTHNRLIVLDHEYIELIALLPGTPLSETSPVAPMFARAPGLIGYVLASDDLAAETAALHERGVVVDGPVPGRLRAADCQERGWLTSRFMAASFPAVALSSLPFLIQHDATGPERLRRIAAPEGVRPHPLGARRLDSITIAVWDLEVARLTYGRAFNLDALPVVADPQLEAQTRRLPLSNGAIILASPSQADTPLAQRLQTHGEGAYALTLTVDDLSAASAYLHTRGVTIEITTDAQGVPQSISIDPSETFGLPLTLIDKASA